MNARAINTTDLTPAQLQRVKEHAARLLELQHQRDMIMDAYDSAMRDTAQVLSEVIQAGDTLALPDLNHCIQWNHVRGGSKWARFMPLGGMGL